MLDDHAVVVVAGDDEHVLQHDLAPRILDHADDLVAARTLGFEHLVIGVPARRFLHVEADAVIARHREDVGAVLFEIGRRGLGGDRRVSMRHDG